MATQTANNATMLARKYRQLKLRIDELKGELDQVTTELREHVEATGETDFGEIMAYQRTSPPKLNATGDLSKKQIEVAMLMELDNTPFINKKLDLKALLEKQDDTQVARALRKCKAEVVPGEKSWYFKSKV